METIHGYEAPKVTQFSVFLDNRVGQLIEILRSLEEPGGCNICGLSVIESSDHAVVRMITDSARCARLQLSQHGLSFSELEVLVVELDSRHTLGSLCGYLLSAELNIHFMYPLLSGDSVPRIALAVDDPTFAGQVLRRKLFDLLGEADLKR
jgi:hypothetical protein